MENTLKMNELCACMERAFSGGEYSVIHTLKTWPAYFEKILDGSQTFEFRNGLDHGFEVGDTLDLREWDPKTKSYTGRSLRVKCTYLLSVFGNWKILSIKPQE